MPGNMLLHADDRISVIEPIKDPSP